MTTFSTDTTGLVRYDGWASGGTPIVGVENVQADPTKEYLAGGSGYQMGMGDLALPESIDDLTAKLGHEAYEIMGAMPSISSSLRTLKLSILAGEIQAVPTFPIKPGQVQIEPDQQTANDLTDYCQRLMDRLSMRSILMQMLDGAENGNKLAEKTAMIAEGGPDNGLYVYKSVNVKKRTSWQFIVDRAYNVTGILARGIDGRRKRYPPEKFMWLTWFPKDNDPRGTSILRACYAAWAFVVRLYPQLLKFVSQFASPSLVVTLPLNAQPQRLPNGQLVSATEHIGYQVRKLQNGSYLIVPNGTGVAPIQIAGEGAAFFNTLDYMDRQLVVAILLQTRATKEAQFGSKADSEKGGDILGLLKQYGQYLLGEMLRNQFFKPIIALNYSEEWAERFAPYIAIGTSDPSDLVNRWNAFSNLVRAGAITPSIAAEAYTLAGLPVPDPEIDEAAAERAFERAQQAAGANAEGDSADQGDSEGGNIPPDTLPQVEQKAA